MHAVVDGDENHQPGDRNASYSDENEGRLRMYGVERKVMDWTEKAAEEISNIAFPFVPVRTDGLEVFRGQLRDIIKNSQPRCETCAHWTEMPSYWGRCKQLVITTPPDFGCVQWKEKP